MLYILMLCFKKLNSKYGNGWICLKIEFRVWTKEVPELKLKELQLTFEGWQKRNCWQSKRKAIRRGIKNLGEWCVIEIKKIVFQGDIGQLLPMLQEVAQDDDFLFEL